jgi:ornithine--oxo-acid transaminase
LLLYRASDLCYCCCGYTYLDILVLQALIVSCCGCFHGRTLAAVSMSCDNEATRGFWPLVDGNVKVDFGDADALAAVFESKLKFI